MRHIQVQLSCQENVIDCTSSTPLYHLRHTYLPCALCYTTTKSTSFMLQVSVVSFLLLFLMAMLWSQQAEGHWNCTADLRGRDGRDGKEGSPGQDGRDGRDGEKGESGPKGEQGARGRKGDRGPISGGVTYVRWGMIECPNDTTLVYAGIAAGTKYEIHGGTSNTLCMPKQPEYMSEQTIYI